MKMLRWIGLLLTFAGICGFLFVADDLRHTGELYGVSAVMLAGVVLSAVSWKKGKLNRAN